MYMYNVLIKCMLNLNDDREMERTRLKYYCAIVRRLYIYLFFYIFSQGMNEKCVYLSEKAQSTY